MLGNDLELMNIFLITFWVCFLIFSMIVNFIDVFKGLILFAKYFEK